MKTLTLKNKFQTNATLLPNDFIDNYMIDANGEFVKVYLFLLRHLDDPCSSLTLTTIADCLNNTEADILRAFRYWEKKGLLRTERDTDGKICRSQEGIPLPPRSLRPSPRQRRHLPLLQHRLQRQWLRKPYRSTASVLRRRSNLFCLLQNNIWVKH